MESVLGYRQAFEAMRRFLERFNEREPHDRKLTIEQLLQWTEIEADGVRLTQRNGTTGSVLSVPFSTTSDPTKHLGESPTTARPTLASST